MNREDRAAALEALALATERLERTAAAVARWRDTPGAVRTRTISSHERAWGEYELALLVCRAICPQKLTPGQRMLAKVVAAQRERPRERGLPRGRSS